ncbi:MAG: hypothetical protein LKF30_09510 [Sphingobium sp.]|jgi:hypothetical protein|nr:hypothetical protein [Sphingobium sp.]MCI1755034.1 hypothetical protein [Sphingobium sp.]MCI2054497.1 hypothetical protein [Sphingobium sp.]
MMMAIAVIFPLGLGVALATIATMFGSHGGKMMAALRMEPYPARDASPCPPAGERAARTRLRLVHEAYPAEPELLAA